MTPVKGGGGGGSMHDPHKGGGGGGGGYFMRDISPKCLITCKNSPLLIVCILTRKAICFIVPIICEGESYKKQAIARMSENCRGTLEENEARR